MTTLSKTIPVLLLVVALMTSNAEAHAPCAREAGAIIRTINFENRTMSLNFRGYGPRVLIWKRDTKVLCNWKFVPVTELKEGTRATVYYHSPFFGKPFITKVVWVNAS